ncbi:hypothetical protein SYNTR_0859 [Candidatus Syntrophocurvum alkaliphilum]|uniref:Uncharacterized protein n=1 Tax=Candidatus Syntrophocurvum alkaliphilum TaxID=2293317 RepID=A0A6I6DEK9_9FIRM|nr:hypothetical protein [Candidatus Syntrophocurvum alkaliphilum]QGT99452.1 hypothetical protein SYNTR_0859 [Candidatus Syntrophocurvum alkaliphilum]
MNQSLNNAFDYRFSKFRKITPVNGLDVTDADNAMQNNYAWSITELGDYIYVGIGRNILYTVLSSGALGDVPIPEELTPQDPINVGEIWRYKKDDCQGWERVYRTTEDINNNGFRFMITYTTPDGETAIYAGAFTLTPELFMVKSTDGVNWHQLDTGIEGFSTRYMAEHRGKLYLGATALLGPGEFRLYSSFDPENEGWDLVDVDGDPNKNPRGIADILFSFNDHLYVGTARETGFELWRTVGTEPELDNWKLVVDKGAGDARNERPWEVGIFNDYIYIGTAIEIAILSLRQTLIPPKGFDLIRVDSNDNWELVIGGTPVVPTEPETGTRGAPLSGNSSGFGNISNAYCWQLQAQGNEFYLGTFSWSVLIPPYIPLIPELLDSIFSANVNAYQNSLQNYINYLTQSNPQLSQISLGDVMQKVSNFIMKLGSRTFGFDLWKSKDGVNWEPVSLNGFGNPHNYGVRMLFLAQNKSLYLGTANPFDGLEVWVKPKDVRINDKFPNDEE